MATTWKSSSTATARRCPDHDLDFLREQERAVRAAGDGGGGAAAGAGAARAAERRAGLGRHGGGGHLRRASGEGVPDGWSHPAGRGGAGWLAAVPGLPRPP